jgi:hypothetical protein
MSAHLFESLPLLGLLLLPDEPIIHFDTDIDQWIPRGVSEDVVLLCQSLEASRAAMSSSLVDLWSGRWRGRLQAQGLFQRGRSERDISMAEGSAGTTGQRPQPTGLKKYGLELWTESWGLKGSRVVLC